MKICSGRRAKSLNHGVQSAWRGLWFGCHRLNSGSHRNRGYLAKNRPEIKTAGCSIVWTHRMTIAGSFEMLTPLRA